MDHTYFENTNRGYSIKLTEKELKRLENPRYTDIYNMFNTALANPTTLSKTKIGKEYVKQIESKGYNALVDNYDTNNTRIAIDALILLKPKKSLGEVKVSELTDADIEAGRKKCEQIGRMFK